MKLLQCNNCQFYSGSPYLICGVHPSGPVGSECPDFLLKSGVQQPGEPWAPQGYSFYNGELIEQPRQVRTSAELLELIDSHPFFTGCCPRCNYRFDKDMQPSVHWDCPHCGWIDDSV